MYSGPRVAIEPSDVDETTVVDVVPVAEQAAACEHEVWQVVEAPGCPVAVTVLQVTAQSVIV